MRIRLKDRAFCRVEESQRLQAVASIGNWKDVSRDLDDIAYSAACLLGTPAAMITIIDHDTMWVAGSFNTRIRSLERTQCVCDHGLASPNQVLCVSNLQSDQRFSNLPVTMGEDAIRFYIGSPLVASGQPVGMLCGFDQQPRPRPSDEHCRALQRLAEAASTRLAARS